MNEIYAHAVKLLAVRDYTVAQLSEKLVSRFGEAPHDVISLLISKRFLNDRRFAENFVAKRKDRGPLRLREELAARGIPGVMAEEILSNTEWPSLKQALKVRMDDWKLRAPLQPRDAARLFRALSRLGYEEDAIREELEQLHEQ